MVYNFLYTFLKCFFLNFQVLLKAGGVAVPLNEISQASSLPGVSTTGPVVSVASGSDPPGIVLHILSIHCLPPPKINSLLLSDLLALLGLSQ